jgi:hypothetical protein
VNIEDFVNVARQWLKDEGLDEDFYPDDEEVEDAAHNLASKFYALATQRPKPRPAIQVVEAPGDLCGGSGVDCPGCRACC